MDEKEAVINFRIDAQLKRAFERVAKAEDRTSSQLLRDFVRQTVALHTARNAQGDIFRPQETPRPATPKKTPQAKKAKPTEGKQALLDIFKKR